MNLNLLHRKEFHAYYWNPDQKLTAIDSMAESTIAILLIYYSVKMPSKYFILNQWTWAAFNLDQRSIKREMPRWSSSWELEAEYSALNTHLFKVTLHKAQRKRNVRWGGVLWSIVFWTWLLQTWTHSSYDYLHKTCIRSSQTKFPHRYGRASPDPTSYWEAIGSGKLHSEGQRELFFQGHAVTGMFLVLQWMILNPCTFRQH